MLWRNLTSGCQRSDCNALAAQLKLEKKIYTTALSRTASPEN
jgi:hypothetical protein